MSTNIILKLSELVMIKYIESCSDMYNKQNAYNRFVEAYTFIYKMHNPECSVDNITQSFDKDCNDHYMTKLMDMCNNAYNKRHDELCEKAIDYLSELNEKLAK